MALTPDQAKQLAEIMTALNKSGIQLQETLKQNLDILLKQGTQLKENSEIAHRTALSMAQGKDATVATNEALAASLDSRMLSLDYDQKALLNAEATRDALITVHDTLKEKNSTEARALENLIKQAAEQVRINKESASRNENAKDFSKIQAALPYAAAGAGAMLFAGGAGAFRRTGKAGNAAKTAGGAGKGKGALREATKILGYTTGGVLGASALQGMAGTWQQWIAQAKQANEEVNAGQTALASFMGQVKDTDASVRAITTTLDGSGKKTSTFGQRIIETQQELAHLGITGTDVTTVYKDMITESRTLGTLMGRLSGRNDVMADTLAKMALKFKTAGLTTKTFAQNLDILGKGYRVNNLTAQSEGLAEEIVGIAAATGQATDAVGLQFKSAMETLGAYSLPRAKQIFRELSVTVAETGVGMDKLLKVAEGFDTLDSAASKVGNLNAMLGGPYLNTLDMVNATEEERIAMIREGVEASGESFDSMDRFKKKAIAKQLGVSVMEARKLLSADQDIIEAKTAAAQDTMATSEEMFIKTEKGQALAAKNAVAIKDQLAAAQKSAFLVNSAYEHIATAGHKVNELVFQLGEQAEGHIGKYVAGMTMETAAVYQRAIDQAKKGEMSFGQILTLMTKDIQIGTRTVAGMATGRYEGQQKGETLKEQAERQQGARGTIPVTETTVNPAVEAIKQILGGEGGLTARIENTIILDGEVIAKQIDERVDLKIREGTR
jgi:hypothetical protein